MNRVDEFIGKTQDVYDGHNEDDNYNSIYFHSNEYLREIFDAVNVEGKDVLTVLGSGDQALYMYDRGAKSVDLYDKNSLTLYYYYLRVWTIKYLNEFYAELYFKNDFLKKLLKYVKPQTEEEMIVYLYWEKFIWYFEEYEDDDFEELFIIGNEPIRNKLYDFYRIMPRIENEQYRFINVDISSEELYLGNKYDIIYKSNISDYVYGSEKVLGVFRDNLYNLLKDNGIIISSNLCYDYCYANEFGVFGSLFNYELLDNGKGFIYRKRR